VDAAPAPVFNDAMLGRRDDALERIADAEVDVLVAGGGITGAGVALEAALRGLRCVLVERADFASGASRRSSKLVHGGLRYLIANDVEVVREALAERAFLVRNAPGLVEPLPHFLPLDGRTGDADGIGRLLAAYDALAGPDAGVPLHRRVDGGFEYHEAVTDDARLTLAVLSAAVARGAVVANHLGVSGWEHGAGGLDVELGGGVLRLRARALVLAVGACLGEHETDLPLRPSRGTHVVLDGTAPRATVTRHPADGRPISVVPWKGRLLVGTTDTPCDDAADVPASAEDVAYLLEGARALLGDPGPPVAAWTGVRPLAGDDDTRTADLSRGDRIVELGPRVVCVTGGKLTTFRPVARRALERTGLAAGTPDAYPVLAAPLPAALDTALHAAATDEMAVTLDDVLTQRLGVSLAAPDEADAHAEVWADAVGAALGWSAAECERQVADYRAGLDRFRVPA
jgi:glycerol-3-phosphate dehydrogenase